MIIASASGPSLWEYSEQLVRKEALTAKFAIRQCNKKRLYWPKLHEPCHRAYFERALPIVKEQMKKAGVRLARLIDITQTAWEQSRNIIRNTEVRAQGARQAGLPES